MDKTIDHHLQLTSYESSQSELGPISSLPNELLCAIFEAGYALPPSKSSDWPFEIIVSHISRRWQYVAANTPRLWTKIAPNGPWRHRFEKATIYLQKSKALPLNLVIKVDILYDTLENIATVCQLIAPHVGRWHGIYLFCNWSRGLNYLLDGLPSAAPLLRCM